LGTLTQVVFVLILLSETKKDWNMSAKRSQQQNNTKNQQFENT
jgi:hypothetical protein